MLEYLPAMMMFVALIVSVALGYPVALSLITLSLLFAWPIFGAVAPIQLYNFVDQIASNYTLAAVPMFVFIGAVLERSGVAEKLFHAMVMWLGNFRGGLALATIAMASVFAAGTGIVGAVEVLIGMMAIPPMIKAGYSKSLISGTICAGGSLGTIIPPSIVVVLYASYANLSVGDLFAGILIPGGAMVACFLIYILLTGEKVERDPKETAVPLGKKLLFTLKAMVPPLVLMALVLGSIFLGIAAVTEAAALGCVGVLLIAFFHGTLSPRLVLDSLKTTSLLTAMILLIAVGGTMFASIFVMHQGGEMVNAFIDGAGFGETGVVLMLLVMVFVLGAILDWVSVLAICLPIFLPILRSFGIDQVWFAVLSIIVIQTSYLTPPMAPSIFYLRAIAPKEITFIDMYKGVVPFVAAQLVVLVLIFLWPDLATWAVD